MKEISQINKEPGFSGDELLKMNPGELMNYFTALDDNAIEEELEKFLEKNKNIAFLSYWEKYLSKEKQVLVDKIILKKTDVYGKSNELPLGLEKRFSEEEIKKIILKMKAIQLTYGCSKGCVFCGFDAVHGVRDFIPYSQLLNLFKKYGHELGDASPFLYWASEPNDYAHKLGLKDKTYADVDQLAQRYSKYSPHVTSKDYSIEWLEYLKNKPNNRDRISAYGMSAKNINKIRRTAGEDINIVGNDQKQYSDIGKNFYSLSNDEKEKALISSRGIGCINGFLLTPRGLYNVLNLKGPTDKFPQGQVVVPFQEFIDIDIKIGDNIENILPFYKIELACNSYENKRLGLDIDRPLVIEKKSGEKLVLVINVGGFIVDIKPFLIPKSLDKSEQFFQEIMGAIKRKEVIIRDGRLDFFSGYNPDEIRDKLIDVFKNSSLKNFLCVKNEEIIYGDKWLLCSDLFFGNNDRNSFYLKGRNKLREKIKIKLYVEHCLLTGTIESIGVKYNAGDR